MIPGKSFYVNPCNIKSDFFQLDKQESQHAIKVLKLFKGDDILILDGLGSTYTAKIMEINSNTVKGKIIKSLPNFGENKVKLLVAPAILKNDRFKIIIEKGTELGVNEFHPLLLERSIKKKINYSRFKKIIISSSKQCQRSRFPILKDISTLEQFLKKSNGVIIAGVMNSGNQIDDLVLKSQKEISIIIGPEGDFSNGEKDLMIKYGVYFCDFGQRRLRSETALIYTLSILHNRFG